MFTKYFNYDLIIVSNDNARIHKWHYYSVTQFDMILYIYYINVIFHFKLDLC